MRQEGLPSLSFSAVRPETERREGKYMQDDRHINDICLERAQAIAHFGSYRIRIAAGSRQESIRWSQEMYNLLGRERVQGPLPITAYISQYVHPDDRDQVRSLFDKAIADNQIATCQYRLVLPSGKMRHIHDFLEYTSSDENGRTFLGQIHDITERRQLEEEQERTHAELRRLISSLDSLREGERKRLAQELHDDLGQLLAAMKMDLNDLRQSMTPLDIKVRRRLDLIGDLVSTMIISVRRIVADLPPKVLEEVGLLEALALMTQTFQDRYQLPCKLSLPHQAFPIDRKIAAAIYRTVQESLSNIVKHANATRVGVELSFVDGHILACITDNGKGVPPDVFQKEGSFGLIGMRQRAASLDGDLQLGSLDGTGTVVRVRIPINPT